MKEGGDLFSTFSRKGHGRQYRVQTPSRFQLSTTLRCTVGLLHDCDGACRETDTATCMIRQLLSVRFIKIL